MASPKRPCITVRALLDAGGRFPSDVAARIVLDVCMALAAPRAAAAPGEPGALDVGRIAIGEDGGAFLSAGPAGSDPASQVRALGAILFECVAGEPAGAPPRPLDVPGIPAPLAAAIDRAIGAAGEPFASPAGLAGAIAAGIPPATHDAVAAYADAILPREGSEEIAGPVPSGRTSPPRTPDAVGTFPKPARAARTSPLPILVGAVCLALGFAIGLSLSRARVPPTPAPAPTSIEHEAVRPPRSVAGGGADSKERPVR